MGSRLHDKASGSSRGLVGVWRKQTQRAMGFCLMVLIAGCYPAKPATPKGAPVSIVKEFSQSGKTMVPDRWWLAMDDEKLTSLIDQSLGGNLELKAAWDRLDQAGAVARQAGAALQPSLNITGDASRRRVSGKNIKTTYLSDFSLGLVASYEVDLWGRIRSTADAAGFDLQASRQDIDTTAVALSAEVANTWYRLTEQQAQLDLLDQQIETNKKYLELVTLRFQRGKAIAIDVVQQQQQLEATQGERKLTESQKKVLEHQLSILLGVSPGGKSKWDKGKLPELPALPDTGLPLKLLGRRPDVQAAHLRLAGANSRVAAAIADRFPRLGISVTAETSAEKVRNLFDNWLASLAANMVAPILDGDRRKSEVDRTRAVSSERLHAYGQVVLEAIKEVEDALVREQKQREYLASLKLQLDLSSKVIEQTRQRYARGAMDYLRVLDALQSHQRLERTYLLARRQLVEYRIALYRALAGGWDLQRSKPLTVTQDAVSEPDVNTKDKQEG